MRRRRLSRTAGADAVPEKRDLQASALDQARISRRAPPAEIPALFTTLRRAVLVLGRLGVQGGIVPCAAGMALAEKFKQSGNIAVVFLGDGTLGEGVVYETLNLASLWNLPVLFVVEANGFAQSTPTALQLAGSFTQRAEAFGIRAMEGDGNDLEAVLRLAGEAVAAVRGDV